MSVIQRFFILSLLFCFIVTSSVARAIISITLKGSWSETINAADLQAGAGSDLIDTYESARNAVSIDIKGTTGSGDNWEVKVSKTDATWHTDFTLYVKRTSDGEGEGSISGGTKYQVVTGFGQIQPYFFKGDGDRRFVEVQLKLSGVSVQIPPDTYITTVYYTVIDTP